MPALSSHRADTFSTQNYNYHYDTIHDTVYSTLGRRALKNDLFKAKSSKIYPVLKARGATFEAYRRSPMQEISSSSSQQTSPRDMLLGLL